MIDEDAMMRRDERIAHPPDDDWRCCGLCGIYLRADEAYYPHRCEGMFFNDPR